jgi:hypothetical protein
LFVPDNHNVNAKYALILTLFSAASARAQTVEPVEKDPAAILEFGAAPGWSINDHKWNLGPSFGGEFTPIEHWLEVESGVTTAFTRHSTEWDVDLLFKKPWTLSKKVEFMVGAGPVWVHTSQAGVAANAAAGEAVLDFMFWPTAKRRFGWYLEPGYGYGFGPGHDRSIGISTGLLIAIH